MKSTTFALQVTNENNLPNFNLTTLPLSTNSVGFNSWNGNLFCCVASLETKL